MADPAVLQAINQATGRIKNPKIRAKVKKALLETGIVESGLQNLNRGMGDSLGFRQERASIYGRQHALSPILSAEDFVREAVPIANQYKRAGDLAAAVQRPAAQYRGRYQQVSRQAQQLLNTSGRFPSASAGSKGAATRTIPGQDRSGERRSLLLNYLLNGGQDTTGQGLLDTVIQIKQTPDVPAKTVKIPGKSTATVSHKGGTTMIDGKPVANWIAARLKRARAAGWQGTVSSGYRSLADQTRIYNSDVRPAAKPGTSNHEFTAFPGGAVDVTDPQQLASILKKLGIKKLKYAGSKDPVHFSFPHNGGY